MVRDLFSLYNWPRTIIDTSWDTNLLRETGSGRWKKNEKETWPGWKGVSQRQGESPYAIYDEVSEAWVG